MLRAAPTDGDRMVIGAGGHGKVVVSTLQMEGSRIRAVYDDDRSLQGSQVLNVPVSGPVAAAPFDGCVTVLGIGDNRTRQRLVATLQARWGRAIHPSAIVHSSVELGEGSVVFAGDIIQPDTVVGRHAIVNTGARIDNDCRLADFVHAGPGSVLAGDVSVGEGALIGAGATVLPGRSIGAWAVVGAGAVVTRDVSASASVVGVPAREVRP